MADKFNFKSAIITVCVVFIADMTTMATNTMALPTPVPDVCLNCICIVESNCKMPDPVCSIDVGTLSCGPFQIKEGYWTDARLKGGDLMGSWKTCTANMTCSEEAVQGYMARYAVFERIGHQPKCEDFARIHNGGPNGFNKTSTLGYWDKVKKCLEG